MSPKFVYCLRRATEEAAIAAFDWLRLGDRQSGGAVAWEAMRQSLAELDFEARSVIGQQSRDESAQFVRGERFGRAGAKFQADLAADAIEGTSYLARGLTNAMSVAAVAPRGALIDAGPAFYMEKFVCPPKARGRIDPASSPAERLTLLGRILDKAVPELTVYVLEKPRHRALVSEIAATGARVALYPAGDVAGAIMAAIPNSGIDCLMGVGGVPEGIISAVAIRALGGEFRGRFAPQLRSEAVEVAKAGLDTKAWLDRDQIVRSDDVYFCATGITSGLLLEGVARGRDDYRTQTLMVAGGTRERQILTSHQPFDQRGRDAAARDVA
jgi:fructose-1,6-bisphosphatase II